MNKLAEVVLEQHAHVQGAGSQPEVALEESLEEILGTATPELVTEILVDDRTSGYRHEYSLTRMMSEALYGSSLSNRAIKPVVTANGLARIGMVVPRQGYVGGIVFDHGDPIVYGDSMTSRSINEDDPVQDAMGEVFYPPMMWVKALRAEAYKNRPESAHELKIGEYLAKLGLYLGSAVNEYGDIIGSTGFMPGVRLLGSWDDPMIDDHINSEPIEAFRLSGLCDQAVLDPDILHDTPTFAKGVLIAGGRLN